MSRKVLDFVREPSGPDLKRMIEALGQISSEVVLVLRPDLDAAPSARALLSRLRPHLVAEAQSSSWPGTELIGDEATVLRFATNREVLDELSSAVDGLYGWRQPSMPEDLGFVRSDGSTVLASISHESDAYLEVSEDEYDRLLKAAPTIAAHVQPHPDSA